LALSNGRGHFWEWPGILQYCVIVVFDCNVYTSVTTTASCTEIVRTIKYAVKFMLYGCIYLAGMWTIATACECKCVFIWCKKTYIKFRFKFNNVHFHRGSFESKHKYLMFLSLFKLTTCFGLCTGPSSGHKTYNWGDYTVWVINKIVWIIKYDICV